MCAFVGALVVWVTQFIPSVVRCISTWFTFPSASFTFAVTVTSHGAKQLLSDNDMVAVGAWFGGGAAVDCISTQCVSVIVGVVLDACMQRLYVPSCPSVMSWNGSCVPSVMLVGVVPRLLPPNGRVIHFCMLYVPGVFVFIVNVGFTVSPWVRVRGLNVDDTVTNGVAVGVISIGVSVIVSSVVVPSLSLAVSVCLVPGRSIVVSGSVTSWFPAVPLSVLVVVSRFPPSSSSVHWMFGFAALLHCACTVNSCSSPCCRLPVLLRLVSVPLGGVGSVIVKL